MQLCSIGNINALHEQMKEGFKKYIAGPIDVVALDAKDKWRAPNFSGDVPFTLTSTTPAVIAEGRIVSLLQDINIDSENMAWWLAWSERWSTNKARDGFHLYDAGFVFYRGQSHQMQPVFRAEWVEHESRPQAAGHPHWHIDQAPFGTNLNAKRLHLAMAGWQCDSAGPPTCWHMKLESHTVLGLWAIRTLEYCHSQLRLYPPQPRRDPLASLRV